MKQNPCTNVYKRLVLNSRYKFHKLMETVGPKEMLSGTIIVYMMLTAIVSPDFPTDCSIGVVMDHMQTTMSALVQSKVDLEKR